MMNKFRNNPPVEMAGSRVERLLDYQSLEEKNMLTGEKVKLDFPASNVLQFYLADGSKVSVRPSGTEPKIKFYIAVKTDLPSTADFPEKNRQLDKRIKSIEEYLMTV